MHPNFEHVTECMKCNREPTFSTPLIQQPWLFSWFWKRKQKISSPHLTSLSTTEKFLQVNTILYSVQLSLLLLLATNQEQEFSGGARALATIQKSFVALRRARVLMMMINHTILFFMVDVVPKRGMTTITQNQGNFTHYYKFINIYSEYEFAIGSPKSCSVWIASKWMNTTALPDQWEFKALNSLCRAMVSSSAQDHEALLFTFFRVAIYLSIHVVCYLSPCPTTQITHPDTINQLAHRAAPFTLWIV